MSKIRIPRQCLPRLNNRITSLYVEHAKIFAKNSNVMIASEEGEYPLPAAAIAVLLLGPGTSITHDASQILSECGTLCAWSDSFGGNCHGFLVPNTKIWTDNSDNIERQAEIATTPKMRTQAVRRMFSIRYGDEYDQTKNRSISQMMGIEGRHVRKTYETCAKLFDIEWHGRVPRIGDMRSDDVVNFIITMTMQEIYNVITAVCYAIGCSTALGFLHRGHSTSFVFDIADLWKEQYVVPFAFEQASLFGNSCDIRVYEFKKQVRGVVKDFVHRERIAQKSVEAINDILWS